MYYNQQNYSKINCCPNCNSPLVGSAIFCTNCGARVDKSNTTQPNFNSGFYQGQQPFPNNAYYNNRAVSKKEFIENYASPNLRKEITVISIILYVMAGLNFVFGCIFSPLTIIDSLILLGLTLGMHIAKNKAFAIAILVLSILEVVASMILNASIGPYLWLIMGICAVCNFYKIDKQYNIFLNQN